MEEKEILLSPDHVPISHTVRRLETGGVEHYIGTMRGEEDYSGLVELIGYLGIPRAF